MSKQQEERRRRFAKMKVRQDQREAAKRDMMQSAVAELVTGNAPKWGDGQRAQHIRCPMQQMFAGGTHVLEHWRAGKKIGERVFKNGIVNQGLNDILGVQFDAVTQKATWYGGLINLSGFSALASDDLYDDIDQAGNGWDTFQDYTDANNGDSAVTRPVWTTEAPSGQSISNSVTQMIYDITVGGTVKGIFIVAGQNALTKGDHAPGATPPNILWSTALFSGGDVVVSISDQLKVTYTVNAAAS